MLTSGWKKSLFYLFVIFLGFLSMSCAKQGKDLQNLVAPSNTTSGVTSAFPAVVKIIGPGGTGLCSGTFISPKAVLTAAHCTKLSGSYTVISSFGTFSTSTKTSFGPGVVEDPNDVALLIFNQGVANANQDQVVSLGDHVAEGDIVRIVGFGCQDLQTKSGSGIKRTGTNQVYRISDYLELITPLASSGVRAIVGPENRAGSCYGDSGGPAMRMDGDRLKVVGLAHAGGVDGDLQFSDYVDITRSDNRDFLYRMNRDYSLGIGGI